MIINLALILGFFLIIKLYVQSPLDLEKEAELDEESHSALKSFSELERSVHEIKSYFEAGNLKTRNCLKIYRKHIKTRRTLYSRFLS